MRWCDRWRLGHDVTGDTVRCAGCHGNAVPRYSLPLAAEAETGRREGSRYASGDVEIFVVTAPQSATLGDGATALTVAGHDGTYQRTGPREEKWLVNIEGTTVAIQLAAPRGAQPESAGNLAGGVTHVILHTFR